MHIFMTFDFKGGHVNLRRNGPYTYGSLVYVLIYILWFFWSCGTIMVLLSSNLWSLFSTHFLMFVWSFGYSLIVLQKLPSPNFADFVLLSNNLIYPIKLYPIQSQDKSFADIFFSISAK